MGHDVTVAASAEFVDLLGEIAAGNVIAAAALPLWATYWLLRGVQS